MQPHPHPVSATGDARPPRLPGPLTHDTLADHFEPAIQLAPAQIEMIVNTVRGRAPGCRLLVFGLGRDAVLWHRINADGYTLFVEDHAHWIRFARQREPGLQVLQVSYEGRTVASSLPLDLEALQRHPLPSELERTDWDVIVVDAPFGFDAGCPGRSLPLHWTRQLMRPHTHVFVDDYERPLERAYTDALIAPHCAQALVVRRPGHEMFWAVGLNEGFQGWSCTDHGGQRHRLRWLLNTPSLRLLMFHDSVEVLPQLGPAGLLDGRTHVLFSFSWHRDEAALRHIRHLLGQGGDRLRRHCHFLLNSAEELAAFQALVPDVPALHFNNAALLDPRPFVPMDLSLGGDSATSRADAGDRPRPNRARPFDAVLNAKALAFKRHHLSVAVPRRLFIAYDVQDKDEGDTRAVDLSALRPAEIRRHLPPAAVAAALGEADVGLMLSAVEGACYASLEYLLCGLPVVSTRSLGGRDDFYDAQNSRVVEADAGAVAAGVVDLQCALARGALDRWTIREQAMRRRADFLARLSGHLQGLLDGVGLPMQARQLLDEAIAEGSKLRAHRNFWVRSVHRPHGGHGEDTALTVPGANAAQARAQIAAGPVSSAWQPSSAASHCPST